ncbi:MAG: sialidase family protein, partial [Candidatus Competibacteraceae bacterium]|nr:sialidase family protein [Candidatus Competibacteraceae bacterium]
MKLLKLKNILFGILSLLVTVSLQAEGFNAEKLTQKPILEHALWDFVIDQQGKLWAAYYGGENTALHLRRPDASELLIKPSEQASSLSGLVVAPTADDMIMLWRAKQPQKNIYFLSGSADAAPTPKPIAGDESEPLTRFKLAQQENTTYMLWYGEKDVADTQQKYHLYFRYAEGDHQQQLSEIERVLPGYYPAWIIDDETIPVFSWTTIDNQLVIAMRRFNRQDKSFGPITKVTDAPPISPIFQAFQSGERWFVLWLGHYGDGSELLLEGVFSDDKGDTWKRFAFEAIKGLDVSRVDMASDGEGHLLIALSGSWRLVRPGDKEDIYLIRSADNGTTWVDPERIRPENIRYTLAKTPSVAFGPGKGEAVMIWEDWRDVRGNIRVGYSSDYGATWEKVVPLGEPGKYNLGLDFKVPKSLVRYGDRWHVVAKRYTDDAMKNHDLIAYDFSLEELNKRAAIQENPAKLSESRLKERVTAYYQALMNEDFQSTYGLSDPFFRARRTLDGYLKQLGRIKYHSFNIGEIEIRDRVARVVENFEASVP